MKTQLLSFFLMAQALAMAQVSTIRIEKEKPLKPKFYSQASYDLYAGKRIYLENFYQLLNTTQKASLQAPPTIVGLGISGYDHHYRWRFSSFLNYYQVIPSPVRLEDSLKATLSGYVLGYAGGMRFSNIKKTLNLNIYIGASAGRMVLLNNATISQRNPFFSPKISIQPKVVIKRFSFSLIAEAEYDVSKPAWKARRWAPGPDHLLTPFRQTCYTAVASIGYRPY